MGILKFRDADGTVREILALKGEKGDPGEFTGGELLKSHINNKGNPHEATAEQVGARPDTWMPTAAEVGARPDTWMPTAAEVGAAPTGYGLGGTPTQIIRSVPDLDDVTTTGWYNFACMDSYIGDFHLNYANVFVMNFDGAGGVWQEVRPLASTAVLRRAYHNGEWSNWVRAMSSANFSYSNGTLTITTD